MQIHDLLHDLQSAIETDQADAVQITRILYSTDASDYQKTRNSDLYDFQRETAGYYTH